MGIFWHFVYFKLMFLGTLAALYNLCVFIAWCFRLLSSYTSISLRYTLNIKTLYFFKFSAKFKALPHSSLQQAVLKRLLPLTFKIMTFLRHGHSSSSYNRISLILDKRLLFYHVFPTVLSPWTSSSTWLWSKCYLTHASFARDYILHLSLATHAELSSFTIKTTFSSTHFDFDDKLKSKKGDMYDNKLYVNSHVIVPQTCNIIVYYLHCVDRVAIIS